MLCLDADLSICLQRVTFHWIPLLLLQWSIESVREYAMNLYLHKARYIPLLKPKQQLKTHKRAGSRAAAKKTKKFWNLRDARPCVPHHGLW